MEGGSKLFEYLTYGVIGVVLLALGVMALRTSWFFLSLLVIPLAETVGRWRPFRGVVAGWGERGGRRDPALWAARLDTDANGGAPERAPEMPRPVRAGVWLGAVVGALPGVWLALRNAAGAGTTSDAVWAIIGGVGLLGSAGMLVGGFVGAGVGLLLGALRERR